MQNQRKKYGLGAVALGLTALMLSIALLVAGTYALFSGNVQTKNHLVAGSLEAKLYREKLTTYALKEDGTMDKEGKIDSTRTAFTSGTSQSIFGLDDSANILVAPSSKFVADMTIENHGTVAFAYWIEVVLESEGANALAEQIQVTVTSGEKTETATVKEGFIVGNESSGIAVVNAGDEGNTSAFTVTVEFLNDTTGTTNNEAKGQEVKFDLIVYAVQYVG